MGERGIAKVLRETRDPTTNDHNAFPGDIWVNTLAKRAFIMEGKGVRTGTWAALGGALDFQESVLAQTTAGAAVESEGNRYLSTATSGGWIDEYIYEYKSGAWEGTAPSEGMVVFDEDTSGYLLYSSAAWGSFTTGITTIAAATDVTIAAVADKQILINDGAGQWKNKTVSGDAVISNLGAVEVSGITLAGGAQGDVYFQGAAGLEKLAAGVSGQFLQTAGAAADPVWASSSSANKLVDGFTLEGGALDPVTTITGQTVGAAALTIPDFANVAQEWCFTAVAQTLTNKTLTAPDINGGTADSLTGFSVRSSGAAFDLEFDTAEVLTGNHKISWDVSDGDRTVSLAGDLTILGDFVQTGAHNIGITTTGATTVTLPTTGTLSTLAGVETFTNKLLSDSTTTIIAVGEPTKMAKFDISGATGTKTMTFVSSHTDDRSVTYPDATDTLVGKATADVFTNKSLDANGSGNVVTNINGAELEDAAATTALGMAIPFIIKKDISNALTTTLYSANFPQKARLVKAWVVESDTNTGNVTIDDGTDAICSAVAYGGTDTDVTDFPNIDDSKSTLAANATLRCLNSVNTDDAMVYMMFIPIA